MEQGPNYPARFLDRLPSLLADAAPVIALSDFSPGPWWGFNGVQTLVLTDTQLHVVQGGHALTTGRLRRSILIADIDGVSHRTRGSGDRVSLRMTIRSGLLPRIYTSKYHSSSDLAEALEARAQT